MENLPTKAPNFLHAIFLSSVERERERELSITTGDEEDTLNTADVVLLVLSGSRGGNCGIAYTNGYQHGVNMGWIAKNCHQAVTPHEVGHMFGCAHNQGRKAK